MKDALGTALACGILGLLLVAQQSIRVAEKGKVPIDEPFLNYWKLTPVERVEFPRANSVLSLENGRWMLIRDTGKQPADPKRVERFVQVLKDLRLTVRDEADPVTLELYGFTRKESVWITIEGGGSRKRFILGGPGPLGNEEYCVAEGERHIFKISDSLSYYAQQGIDYWKGTF